MKDLVAMLRKEVIPAIGCTEPIAVSLCVAKAKERLGCEPTEIDVYLSKNIYKNAMSVGIPNTGMVGLPIAIALGATVGKSEYQLEVLKDTNKEAVEYAKKFLERTRINVQVDENAPDILYIKVIAKKDGKEGEAIIAKDHTHFVETDELSQNNAKVHACHCNRETENNELSLRVVYDFVQNVNIEDVRFLLDGAKMNINAAELSFMGKYGHGLGRMLHSLRASNEKAKEMNLLSIFGDSLFTKILSYTCGACDARMSGAMIPVMSNSGSGNQGISCSVPVYLYALENNCDEEKTIRSLTLSNMTVIYIKESLGRLSALCGCVVAATGSAVGITYLMGGGYDEITYAIKNMIANISGMICDGAKPGCSMKVTSGISTAILSACLAMNHSYADAIEGIVEEDIDRTIHNLTRIGRDGMRETDNLIVDIMTHKKN